MIVIYGTASSGKSKIAEDMAVRIASENSTGLSYVATMESESEASKIRIKKHRMQREGKGFDTIEEPYKLSVHALDVRNKTVLLECISNFCANVYYKKLGDSVADEKDIRELSDYIVSQIKELSQYVTEIIIVTNDIFRDGRNYDKWTEAYMRLLATVNNSLMEMCDSFYEVTSGVPECIKNQNIK